METVQPKLNIKRLIVSIVILGAIAFFAFKFAYQMGVELGDKTTEVYHFSEKQTVELQDGQHGYVDKHFKVWTEKGYYFDPKNKDIKKCTSSVFNPDRPECASLDAPN